MLYLFVIYTYPECSHQTSIFQVFPPHALLLTVTGVPVQLCSCIPHVRVKSRLWIILFGAIAWKTFFGATTQEMFLVMCGRCFGDMCWFCLLMYWQCAGGSLAMFDVRCLFGAVAGDVLVI